MVWKLSPEFLFVCGILEHIMHVNLATKMLARIASLLSAAEFESAEIS